MLNNRIRTTIAICVSFLSVLVYVIKLRPICLYWGLTRGEANRPMPGDELVPNSGPTTTNAVTINVPPACVWPWLVQMGPGRAGAYTYDWVENILGLNMHSANRIVPEWQNMKAGDRYPLGKSGPALEVVTFEPERALVLAFPNGQWSWSFLLEEVDHGKTRLITRNRMPVPGVLDRIRLELMLPGAFVMMRKMLLGIKQRAERNTAECK